MADTTGNAQDETHATAAPDGVHGHLSRRLLRLERIAADRRGRFHVLEMVAVPASAAATSAPTSVLCPATASESTVSAPPIAESPIARSAVRGDER